MAGMDTDGESTSASPPSSSSANRADLDFLLDADDFGWVSNRTALVLLEWSRPSFDFDRAPSARPRLSSGRRDMDVARENGQRRARLYSLRRPNKDGKRERKAFIYYIGKTAKKERIVGTAHPRLDACARYSQGRLATTCLVCLGPQLVKRGP